MYNDHDGGAEVFRFEMRGNFAHFSLRGGGGVINKADHKCDVERNSAVTLATWLLRHVAI